MGVPSLRQLDQSLRLGWMGGRVRGKKGCRISDTTMSRVCAQMKVEVLEELMEGIGQKIRQEGMLGVEIQGQRRRVGVIDGTGLGGQLASVLMQVGEAATFLGLAPIAKRGKELPVSLTLIQSTAKSTRLDYLLGDGLYACKEFWRVCESAGIAGVVKTSEESLNILKDANGMFEAKGRLEASASTQSSLLPLERAL